RAAGRRESMTVASTSSFSRIKEVATAWDQLQQMLRAGDRGYLVPVVIPRDRRGFGWLGLSGVVVYLLGMALAVNAGWIRSFLFAAGAVLTVLALLWFWRQAIIEIEQGTTGILSRFGAVVGTLGPGRHFLWWPWLKI